MRRFATSALLCALALPAATAVGLLGTEAPARASVSIAITFDALVQRSMSVVVITPIEQRAVWENGRIYTYTEVHVDTKVAGSLAVGDIAWVRTMGGVVGKVGQVVDGEAVLTLGRPTLVFLHDRGLLATGAMPGGAGGPLEVTARAQGQFGIRLDEQSRPTLVRSSAVGAVLPPRPGAPTPGPFAADVLHGRAVPDAARDIASAWTRLHAP